MTKKKTLWLCLDGIRVDALKKAAPFISKTLLTKHHVNYSLQCRNEIPVSTPCWLSLIRGQSVATHGIKTNRQRIPPVDKSRLESEHKIRLEVYHRGWDRFSRFFHSSTPTHRVYSSKPLLKRLKSTPSSRLPEYLCYYDVTADDAGHGHGFSPHVREYLREIERFDTLVREVCRLLEERSLTHKEQWLLVLLTDHGGSTIPSYRRPKQLTRGLVKSNNHLRSTLKKYTGTHSDPSHPQHRRYFQIYLEINPGQRHPTTTTQNIDPSLDYRSPLQRTLSWFHSYRGGSSEEDEVNKYIQENPEQAQKLMATIMPAQGIATMFKGDDDNLPEKIDEDKKKEDPNITPWHAVQGCDCEHMLVKTTEVNNLKKQHLLNKDTLSRLLNLIENHEIYDGSHKNIVYESVGGLCHYHIMNGMAMPV